MKPLLLTLLIATTALPACATTSALNTAPPTVRDLNRTEAIASARKDASRIYGTGSGALLNAEYRNGFWVVDSVAASGATLHYAISARDGTIRERSMLQ